jgi:type II secretory pathway component PulF
MAERLRQGWLAHPVRGFLGHRHQLALFRQLHSLLKAGIGIPTLFAEIQKYAPDAGSRAALAEVARRIDGGAKLADALRVPGLPIDDITLELMAAAEETGSLEAMFARTCERMEETQQLRWKVVTSAIYPLYLLAAIVLVGPLLALPATVTAHGGETAGLGGAYIGGLVRNLAGAAFGAAVVFFSPLLIDVLGWERGWDALRMQLPGLGPLYRNLYVARFAETFATALGAGMEAGKVVSLSVRATGSAVLRPLEDRMVQTLRQGGTFVDAVSLLGLFQGPELGTVAIGEKTGELDGQMKRLAQEAWEAVLRGVKFATYAALAVVVGFALLAIVSQLLGTLFGPIQSYYRLAGDGS